MGGRDDVAGERLVGQVRGALARGDLLEAFDLVEQAGLDAGDPALTWLRCSQVLALARAGDTDGAVARYEAFGLAGAGDVAAQSLRARLLKDRAFAAPAGTAAGLLAEAGQAYEAVYRRSGDSFPGINAASLALLAGDTARSRALAAEVLADPVVQASGDYFAAATRAEALLLSGRTGEAAAALADATSRFPADYGAWSTTAGQIARLCGPLGLGREEGESLLGALRPPSVAVFAGHMFAEGAAEAEAGLRARVDAALERLGVGFGYGPLACGADIVVAEALLDRGAELNVVLPFREEDFLAHSVRPGGPGWEARYSACLERAASVTFAAEMEYVGDDGQFAYGARLAMGLARLRARHLGTRAVQLVAWDRRPTAGDAGTAADVANWQAQGGVTEVVDPGPVPRRLDRPSATSAGGDGTGRVLRAIVFTDFPGFSKLPEPHIPRFWNGVMRVAADVVARHADRVDYRNTWGDALYLVVRSVPDAADLVLDLQTALDGVAQQALGLPPGAAMRIGVHYGPLYEGHDWVTGRPNYYGTQVSRAARIEPVTPPGAVYVTEPFAAIAALEAPERFTCAYVGRVQLAKGYGVHRMYRLGRRAG